jgi:maleate isomerase
VTPYNTPMTRRLVGFLAEHGVRTVTTIPLDQAAEQLVVRDHEDAEAAFVCCTNVPTYDLLDPLTQAIGKPVLTANEVLMRAALRALGAPAVGVTPRVAGAPMSGG